MSRCYRYAIARFPTDGVRNETLNLAIVLLRGDKLEVRLPRSLDKLRAISAAVDPEEVRAALERLPGAYEDLRVAGDALSDDWPAKLQEVSPCAFSLAADIYAESDSALSNVLDRLVSRLIDPEPAPYRPSVNKNTRLLSDMKSAFRVERVLARKGEGLEDHRIVSNHKIAEGLSAELLLKNGAMHIVQSADASLENPSPRRAISSIAVSTLIFEQARMKFGEKATRSRLVYKASSATEVMISPSLDAAEHQGAQLVNWESRDDRNRFIAEMSALAQPIEGARSRPMNVHASIQHKLKLN